jgi:DNA helicase-2/ATP-dependent DNA helicase PcrA
VRFYQRREVKDVLAYLRLIHNRNDEASFTRVVNVPPRGIGAKTVERLRNYAGAYGLTMWDAAEAAAAGRLGDVTGRSQSSLADFTRGINGLRDYEYGVLPALLDAVLAFSGYEIYLRDSEQESAERLDNVMQLRAVMEQYEDVGPEDGDLATFLQDVALVSDVDELTDDSGAVTLITLHAAKGLEFPVVFMVGMEEGVLPHIRAFDDPRQMEEERRLAYVGITRAMDSLFLTRSYRRFAYGQPAVNPASRFLSEIPSRFLAPFDSGGPRSYVQAASAPPREEFRPPDALWNAGDRVVHPKFGAGTVVAVQQRPDDIELSVAFENAGVKRLLQSFAPLSPA